MRPTIFSFKVGLRSPEAILSHPTLRFEQLHPPSVIQIDRVAFVRVEVDFQLVPLPTRTSRSSNTTLQVDSTRRLMRRRS